MESCELMVGFLGNGSELHETDVLGRSALMYAVNFSQLDTVEFLLNQGISINSTASGEQTTYFLIMVFI